jgi:2-oxoglutarate ferredoxin oxidoreductase subunit alpha
MLLAFELAERYRNPVMLCADGMIGQMMEPVSFPTTGRGPPMGTTDWALTGADGRKPRVVNSLVLAPEALDAHNRRLAAKYARVAEREQRFELYGAEDGYELLVTAFGTMARIVKTAIDELAEQNVRVALFRPIMINPFPYTALRAAMDGIDGDGPVLDIEMNMGQMLYDVRLAAEGSRPIEFLGTAGGIVRSPDDVASAIRGLLATPNAGPRGTTEVDR